VEDARREVLRGFVRDQGGYARVVQAFRLTPSQGSYLSQLIARDSAASFGERSAKNWEERLKLRPGVLVRPDMPGLPQLVRSADDLPFLPGFEGLNVPVLAAAASMGGGAERMEDDFVVGRITVSPQWIAKTIKPLTKPENLRFIHGYGDSMEPTFSDGDILLVDTGVRHPDIDGIYVLAANERLFIKRVTERIGGGHEITSDNPKVKTVQALDGSQPVEVLGRVVWAWNGKKL